MRAPTHDAGAQRKSIAKPVAEPSLVRYTPLGKYFYPKDFSHAIDFHHQERRRIYRDVTELAPWSWFGYASR
jgi:hypothetical protein